MACSITADTLLNCKLMGGVLNLYVGTWTDTLTYTISGTTASLITGFGGTTSSFYKVQQYDNVATFAYELETDPASGAAGWMQTCTFNLYNSNATLANIIKILGQGVFQVIIQDRNGQYFFMGYSSPAQTTVGSGSLGQTSAAMNGMAVTIVSRDNNPFYQVTAAAVATVIA